MKFSCPDCRSQIKLSVEEIQKPQCNVTCPCCQKTIALKNNLPAKQDSQQ